MDKFTNYLRNFISQKMAERTKKTRSKASCQNSRFLFFLTRSFASLSHFLRNCLTLNWSFYPIELSFCLWFLKFINFFKNFPQWETNFPLDSEELEDRKEQKESDATQSAHPDMASIAYISSSNGPEVVDGISMELDKRDLWRTFYRYGTEMIITKVHFGIFLILTFFFKVGRRMFPSMKVSVNGLDPQKTYAMIVDILPVDDSRYRYVYNSSKVRFRFSSMISPIIYFNSGSLSETLTQICQIEFTSIRNRRRRDLTGWGKKMWKA